jgi:peptidoglycan hydrolase-like protein with peptidoglycan-binding domain
MIEHLLGGLLSGVPQAIVELLRIRAETQKAPGSVVLRFGHRGEIVSAIQERLVELGEALDVDGIYGRRTQAAIIKLQARSGIGADGLCGPKTFAALWPPPQP